MLERIHEVLSDIERKHEVTVLYACDSGSRAWGFPSTDSDYDVRFIYIHRPDWYLSIDDSEDVIELPVDDALDISGWDIRKALKLFRKSNPSLHEWLQSEIEYKRYEPFTQRLLQLAPDYFSPVASLHHYLNLAQHNYRDVQEHKEVRIRNYFHVLRPLLAAMWIRTYSETPPPVFQILLNRLVKDLPLHTEMMTLLEKKIRGHEMDLQAKIPAVDQFIETQIQALQEHLKSIHHHHQEVNEELNVLFRETLQNLFKAS